MITVFRPQRECFKAFVTRSSLEVACVELYGEIEFVALIILLPSACRARRLDQAL